LWLTTKIYRKPETELKSSPTQSVQLATLRALASLGQSFSWGPSLSPFHFAIHFSGDLRRLTRVIGVAITFFGLVLLAIIAHTGWSANQLATEQERTLLENALNESIARALNEQKSVAWWDDPVVKITDEAIDLEFTDANFGVFLTETYAHDEVYILNAADRPLYAFAHEERLDPSSFEERRPALEALIAEIRRGDRSRLRPRPDIIGESMDRYHILIPAQSARWAGHIVSVDDKPAVVAGMTMVPNTDMTLLKGTPNVLLSITYIDDAFTSEIGHSLLLNDLKLVPQPAKADGVVFEPFVGDDGTPVGYLSWTTRRPGQRLLTVILPLVAFGVLATGLLSSTILRRLRRASEKLAQREAQARHEAKHDALSGLPNRVHMVEKIDSFLQDRLLETHDNRAVAAYVDIDRFKDVNDTLGHEAGDQLIKLVAQRLLNCLRTNDFLARFGGDEFVILCAPAGPDASTVAERVAQAFSLPFSIKGQNVRVTASVGIAIAPENGVTADELMRHADIALYEAKDQGRDRAVLFSEKMAQQVERRRDIEMELRTAIETDMLCLHYQPIVASHSGEIVGLEALLRWRHPRYGEMSPATFVPIAENAGLLPALGEWVLGQAMQDWKRWPHLEISVNLSPAQFRHVDLETTLRKLVGQYGVDPTAFVLEITEGVLLEATERTNSMLDALRAIGFKTALDDFGTGYSSLAYLCNFKFDKIKIDRSFVARISQVDISRTIVQSVVTIGRSLGMDIVAEGVETEFEAMMMTKLGCTELQGYYFSKPIDADEIPDLLHSYRPRSAFFRKAAYRASHRAAGNR
jgi:diguanylate cyclase (GGDEF)-like protein